jgi:hypothetical protein
MMKNRIGYHNDKIILPAGMDYKLPSTCGHYSVQALICSVTSLVPGCGNGNKGGNLNFTYMRIAHLYSMFCVKKGRRVCVWCHVSLSVVLLSFFFFYLYSRFLKVVPKLVHASFELSEFAKFVFNLK